MDSKGRNWLLTRSLYWLPVGAGSSPPFLRTQVSAWLLVGSARRTEGCLLRRLCDTLRLQRNPATWDTGVSEKYVVDHGLGISFLCTE